MKVQKPVLRTVTGWWRGPDSSGSRKQGWKHPVRGCFLLSKLPLTRDMLFNYALVDIFVSFVITVRTTNSASHHISQLNKHATL